MKNLEEKMNDSQIKDELQLKGSNETVNFLCTKFDEYEK